jgi:hypothetical protein
LKASGFERPEPNRIPPLGLGGSAALFGAGALLLFLTTRVAVPAFVSATRAETVVMWFLAASIILFGPCFSRLPCCCVENDVQEGWVRWARGCGFAG